MKKLELNAHEYDNLMYLARKANQATAIKNKIVNGIIIVLVPIELAISLGY